jgi:anti-anti-sigma factor
VQYEFLENRKDVLVIILEGRIDVYVADHIDVFLDKLAKDHPECHILLDLSKLEYMNSSCIRILISLKRRLEKVNKEVKIFSPSEICKKLIEVVKLDKLIDTYESKDGAVQSLLGSLKDFT